VSSGGAFDGTGLLISSAHGTDPLGLSTLCLVRRHSLQMEDSGNAVAVQSWTLYAVGVCLILSRL